MRIALAQTNPLIGDLAGIAQQLQDWCQQAADQGADLIVFPELASLGYPPRDMLERSRLIAAQWTMLETLATKLTIPALVGCAQAVGAEDPYQPQLYNSLALLDNGRIARTYHKRLLPTYDVFDERRYFRPGSASCIVEIKGKRIGLTICEDVWLPEFSGVHYQQDPIADLIGHVDVVVNVAASPYSVFKPALRRQVVQSIAQRTGVPVVYVNQVGGQDELLFDGDSCVLDANGERFVSAPRWRQALVIADLNSTTTTTPQFDTIADLHQGLVAGMSDYCNKTQQKSVVLGLSGGIDSAVVAALAVDALGPERVFGILMPGPYSSAGSIADARKLAENLGIAYEVCAISESVDSIHTSLHPLFANTDSNVAEENIQSRLRGVLVMAYANKFGAMALTTGNKSELATGYCTIYGDMNGGLNPIGDLYKTQVYELAAYLNRDHERIPADTLSKPPSAELRPDQKDSDSLPPYEVLDRILRAYIEHGHGIAELIAAGEDETTVRRIIRLTEINEYKRRQAAPALRVTDKAFGVGRRIPLARRLE